MSQTALLNIRGAPAEQTPINNLHGIDAMRFRLNTSRERDGANSIFFHDMTSAVE
jgi:hypothetical protein